MIAISRSAFSKKIESASIGAFRSRYSPIGIDFGSAQIKIIQLCHHRGRIALYRKAIVPTPAGSVKDGRINKPEPLIDVLKKVRQSAGFNKNKANLALCSQSFFLRRVTLPPMKNAEIKKAMRWEVEKYFPLSSSEAVFDYCLIVKSAEMNNSSSDYLLAAAAKETADIYTTVAQKAGFYPASLEIEPLARFRALCLSGQADRDRANTCQALLNIGHGSTSLLIACGGSFQFYRNIKFGIDNLCRHVAESKSLNCHEAYQLIFSRGTLVERGLQEAAEELALEIGQSLSYWYEQSARTEPQMDEVKICGGGAAVPGLAAYIAGRLQLKARLFSPLPTGSVKCRSLTPKQKFEGALCTAAYGLALRGWLT